MFHHVKEVCSFQASDVSDRCYSSIEPLTRIDLHPVGKHKPYALHLDTTTAAVIHSGPVLHRDRINQLLGSFFPRRAHALHAVDQCIMASAMSAKTLNENFQYYSQEFFLPLDKGRTLSRRSSATSDASIKSNISSMSISSTTSTDSGMGSGDGIVKGLTILGVCLVYAFALFFIASFTAALSYLFKFEFKGNKKFFFFVLTPEAYRKR